MSWTIEITDTAKRQLKKMDKPIARKIADYMSDYISQLPDPRAIGKPLTGNQLGSFWRYRLGDYRVICDIQDNKLIILVISTGHRSNIYD